MMKAAIFEKYGPPEVVSIQERPKPVPKDDELLIRIHATTVSAGDWRIRSSSVPAGFGPLIRLAFGITRPRQQILGTELAGIVESIGDKVSAFAVGDAVIANPGSHLGAHAEYIALREDAAVALKPDNLSFEEAAALSFGGSTALDFLQNKAGIKAGDQVLINGASGAVGSAAVQLAKYFGAEVSAVCSSANHALVQSIGAGQVIDYATTDFTQLGQRWDIIMDTIGNAPWTRVEPVLNENGRLLMIVATLCETLKATFVSRKNGKKAIAGTARETAEDLKFLAKLAEQEAFKPVIDQIFPFNQIVAAHSRVDSGHKRGSVVVQLIN
ncbi:MAG: NAD(P)-dependent alcohol dehydrogenase [Thiotrichales bacterium]